MDTHIDQVGNQVAGIEDSSMDYSVEKPVDNPVDSSINYSVVVQ